MIFNSLEFLIFLPIVLAGYFLSPVKIKNYFLLVASYFFYMCWNVKYALLLLGSTLISYLCGLILEKQKSNLAKKWTVAVCFIANLGLLFIFKYLSFFFRTIEKVLEFTNNHVELPQVSLLLPVGISFYIFQTLGYVMDVYRGEVKAERKFATYALFVSFFPQLVAGPIERSKNMLRQLNGEPAKFDFERAKSGFLLMLWGFFLKLVIADRIAVFVDNVYGDYNAYSGVYLIVATILFAFQIYCDFYGYSIIALGVAKIIGISLTENFNAPYFSVSVSQFWKNWHISLTSWFRDYIYIPMGGNRKGKWRKYWNILVVFLVSGLWHGASLSFVVWGGLNGIYQIVGSITDKYRERLCNLLRIQRNSLGCKLVRGVMTFGFVDFAWVFFRSNGLREALQIVRCMLTVHNPWVLFDGSLYNCGIDQKNMGLLFICLLILAVVDVYKKRNIHIHSLILEQDGWFQIAFISLAIVFIMIFGKYGPMYDAKNFIYFQF